LQWIARFCHALLPLSVTCKQRFECSARAVFRASQVLHPALPVACPSAYEWQPRKFCPRATCSLCGIGKPACAVNMASNILARWRSSVSRPSRNQSYRPASNSRAVTHSPRSRQSRARLMAARSSQDLACCCRAIASACSKCVSALLMSGSGASHAISPAIRCTSDSHLFLRSARSRRRLHLPELHSARFWLRSGCRTASQLDGGGAMGTILKQNGYATSWFGKNHNTPSES
jgi:hypothetical protein